MANAYKCDMTGAVQEGAGVRNVVVDLGATGALHVQFYTRRGKDQLVGPGELSPAAAEKIQKALSVLADNSGKPSK